MLEELAMNAWPSLQSVLYDGWVLRFADGYTRRANSIHPLYPSSISVEDKIQTCEKIYRGRGLKVVFKMTPAAQPQDLDQTLEAKGYQTDARTSVQVLSLNGLDGPPEHAALLTESLSDEWLSAFCRLSRIDEQRKKIMQQMLNNLVASRCFASVQYQGRIAACGMGVLQGQFVGLFDIVTDADFRRRGLGRQLVLNILDWAQSHGAQTAYLQVMLNNEPALRLYDGLGFKEVYQYWYRAKQ